MRTYTAFRDAIEEALRDSTNTYWSTGEIDSRITTFLREAARYVPHLVRITYQIESRYGSASSTSSGNLVDATKTQFESTDTGKRVFNDTDKTWADVLSYTSTSQVGLSHDIMASGENYYLYNKGCSNNRQINVEDVLDYVGENWGIRRLEYPIGIRRDVDWVDSAGIVQIGLDRQPDDSDPNNTDRVIDIHVWFNKRHKFSQLTDFAGAVNNAGGYSKGATAMSINGLQSSGTIERDQEFTLANRDQVYTVTTAGTIATNAVTNLAFYPGLDADVANSVVVTFSQSTLSEELEEVGLEYVVAKCLIDEANTHIPTFSLGGTDTYKRFLDAATLRMRDVTRKLQRMARPEPTVRWGRL